MNWSDLALNPESHRQIEQMKSWFSRRPSVVRKGGMVKNIEPGFRALFYGPGGTGKTLTATLLGKQFDKEVYKIDLSKVVSKYIGETEKNLEKRFNKAGKKDWILFFDEADALFGKRTNVQDSHDRYANQEVAYLLQRMEDFPGVIIFATNNKKNIDEAFLRRLNTVVHFPMPAVAERYKIWGNSIAANTDFPKDVDLTAITQNMS